MKKWKIEPIPSIGGTTPKKLIFTGHDSFTRSTFSIKEPKKELAIVSWLRRVIGRIMYYL